MADSTEVGVGYVRLVPSMAGFSSDASDKLGKGLSGPLKQSGQEGGKSFISGLSDTLQSAGGKMTSIGAQLYLEWTQPLAHLGMKAIQMASDLNESANKVRVVFGDQAGVIDEFATNAAVNMGLSKKTALDAAGGFGNMFRQLGFGAPVTAAMSQSMIALAGDFTSFTNIPVDQVLEAQSAAFRGEYDSLQRFLPLITAASVEQKAMELTGKGSAKQLTAQDKALATYQLMLEGAGDAQGDFARTAHDDANATRSATAQAENAATTIGQKLLPIKEKLVAIVGQLLDRYNKLSPSLQKVIIGGLLIAAALGPVVAVIGTLVTIIGALIASPIILVLIGIGVAVALLGLLVAKHFAGVKKWIDVFWGALQAVWRWVSGNWQTIFVALTGPIGLAAIFIARHWDIVVAVLKGAGQAIMAIGRFFVSLWGVAQQVWGWFSGTFGAGWAQLWTGVSLAIQVAWAVIQAVVSGLTTAVSAVGSALSAALDFIQGKWNQGWANLKHGFAETWDFFSGIVSTVLGVITGIIQVALDYIQARWNEAWAALEPIVTAVKDWVMARVDEIVGFFVGVWDRVSGAMDTLQVGVTAVFTAIKDWALSQVDDVVAVFVGVWDRVSGAMDTLRDGVTAVFTAIKDWAMNQVDDVVQLFANIWGRVSGPINTLRTGITDAFTAMKDWAADRISDIVNAFAGLPGRVGDVISSIAGKISGPFIDAFNTIRNKWNSTVGGFGINIPSVLGFGGAHFTIPKMHTGGIYNPAGYGNEGPAILKRGEGVFTAEQMKALGRQRNAPTGEVRSVVELNAGGLDRALMEWLRSSIRAKGGNVQLVLGAPGR